MEKIPDWLVSPARRLDGMRDADRFPHALLVHGPLGSGRRYLAFRTAARLLGLADDRLIERLGAGGRVPDECAAAHPDLRIVQPEPDKKTVAVEQIRELTAFLGLTSHQKGAKVAVIVPADVMTRSAADALLKTLEEPPDGSYLLLICDSLARLPATVVSRCHRIRIPLADREEALAWLRNMDADARWEVALDLAGGAPFTARDMHQQGTLEAAGKLRRDFDALIRAEAAPAAVAKRWNDKEDLRLCLRLLYRIVADEVRRNYTEADAGAKSPKGSLQYSGEMLNIDADFDLLRELGLLQQRIGSGLNMELNLDSILTRWYGVGRRRAS